MIILIIFVVAFTLALLLNYLYKRTNAYNNQFVDVRKFSSASEIGNNIEIVNIGSNHPKFGLNYDGLDIKGENWAVGPQTFEYDFTILRKYSSHLSPGAVVVVPVCLLSFFLFRQINRGLHVKYYSFLEPSEIVGYSKFEYFSRYVFPLLFHPKCLKSLIKDSAKDSRLLLSENMCKSETDIEKDAQKWIDGWNKEFGVEIPHPVLNSRHKDNIEKSIGELRKILDYCLNNGFKPVVLVLPVTHYLSCKFTNEFIDNYVLNNISKANESNVPVLNYLKDERFTDTTLYINSFFFNTKGRKEFTKQFVEDLRAQSIL